MRKKKDPTVRESTLASGWKVEAEEPLSSAEEAPVMAEVEPEQSQEVTATKPELSNGALVIFGVFGGLYLLYAWVWLSWVKSYSEVNAEQLAASGTLGSVLQQIVFWAAPLAPILWFIAVLLLTRGKNTRWLMLWIMIGTIVLLPLPMFAGGGN
jgi:hypothetical protein